MTIVRDVAGTGAGRARPSSAEELSRAMVTPPLAERRAADREGSVGLTPPFTPSLEPTHRQAPAPFPTNPSSVLSTAHSPAAQMHESRPSPLALAQIPWIYVDVDRLVFALLLFLPRCSHVEVKLTPWDPADRRYPNRGMSTYAPCRSALSFQNGKSPAWAAGTPMLRPGQPFAAQRPRATPGGRSAWDVPSPSPMGPSSASNSALASVLAAIR